MKVALVHPRLSYTPSQPPLGLGYIAACLERAGHEVLFIEGAFMDSDAATAERVAAFGARLVGISVMVNYFTASLQLARAIKARCPDATVTVGGAHPSVVPDDFLAEPAIDFVLVGEGEEAFTRLADELDRGTPDLTDVPGLRWRGGMANLPRAPRITDLDKLPWPARHLFPMDQYRHRGYVVSFGMHGPNFNLITSRGCPYRCNFCDHSVYGSKPYSRTIKDVVDEIEHTARTYNIRNFDVMDDTFTMRASYVEAFCNELIARDLGLFWSCRLRVNGVTRDLMALMARAGCVRFSVGIESIDERVLAATNKNISVDQLMSVLKWAKEFDMLTIGNFMIGNLGDDHESIEKTLRFSLETEEIDIPSWVVLVPLPGTEVAEIGKSRGWIRSFDWDEYTMNTKDLPLMRNEALTHADIQALYARVAKAVRPKVQHAMKVLHEPRRALYSAEELVPC